MSWGVYTTQCWLSLQAAFCTRCCVGKRADHARHPHGPPRLRRTDPALWSRDALVNYLGSIWPSRLPTVLDMPVRSWRPAQVKRLLPLGVDISMTNAASSGAPMIQAGTSQLIDEMVSMVSFLSGGCATGLWREVSFTPHQCLRDRTSPSRPVGMFRAPAAPQVNKGAVPHRGCRHRLTTTSLPHRQAHSSPLPTVLPHQRRISAVSPWVLPRARHAALRHRFHRHRAHRRRFWFREHRVQRGGHRPDPLCVVLDLGSECLLFWT